MRQGQYPLTRQDVHAVVMQHLHRHLAIRDFGSRCTAAMLLSAVVAAAAGLTSVVAVARRLLGLPSGETLRKAPPGWLTSLVTSSPAISSTWLRDLPHAGSAR